MTSAPAWEFTRENQTNYGVNARTAPAVNLYHPVSNLSIGGLDRNGANANGQTDTFGIYAFDTLTLTERIGDQRRAASRRITIPNMTAPPPAAAADAGLSPARPDSRPAARSPLSIPLNPAIWLTGKPGRCTA